MHKRINLISIIFVLLVFIITCLILKFKNNSDIEVANNSDSNSITNSISERKQQEIIETKNNIIKDHDIENTQEKISKEQTTPVVEVPKQTEQKNQKEVASSSNTKKTTSQNSNIKINTSTKNNTTKNTKKAPTTLKNEEAKNKIDEHPQQTQSTKKQTQDKKTKNTNASNSSNTNKTQDEEKYIRNDAMIEKIKNIINNNPSADMKEYGYSIIVDSSIKEKTNQFTFTENRVKAMMTNKFGTIRIYAEDYYYNGQLVMTECYIL